MNTRHVRPLRKLLAPLALATLAITAAACGSDDGGSGDGASSGGGGGDGGVTVSAVWVREPADGTSATAAYGVITNGTDDTVTLIGASTPVTDEVQIHETLMSDDGAMSMQEEGGFAIDARDSFTLEPGGPHVMLLDVDAADIVDPVEITFEFDGADAVSTSATVESIAGGSDEMDDMDMDDMDHGGTDDTGHDMDEDMEDTGS